MTTRDHAPAGVPCWTDLWTSDVEGSRRFYGEVLGWGSDEPNPEFGGYFMFTRGGVPIAGGMGDMGDMRAENRWTVYFATDDIEATLKTAEAEKAQIASPAMEVGDAGIQAMLVDPTGATVGLWQAREFPGFTTVSEPGAPSWFELHTRDHAGALDFYRATLGAPINLVADDDSFRYAMVGNPAGGEDVAGIMDAAAFLPAGSPATWSVYWEVDDVAATTAKVKTLGGTVVSDAQDTPYGCLAECRDPSGATFKLRKPNA